MLAERPAWCTDGCAVLTARQISPSPSPSHPILSPYLTSPPSPTSPPRASHAYLSTRDASRLLSLSFFLSSLLVRFTTSLCPRVSPDRNAPSPSLAAAPARLRLRRLLVPSLFLFLPRLLKWPTTTFFLFDLTLVFHTLSTSLPWPGLAPVSRFSHPTLVTDPATPAVSRSKVHATTTTSRPSPPAVQFMPATPSS